MRFFVMENLVKQALSVLTLYTKCRFDVNKIEGLGLDTVDFSLF